MMKHNHSLSTDRPHFSGTRLRIARRLSRRTQEELAREASVDQALISHAERGIAPSPETAAALAEVLGVAPSFFETESATQLFDEDVHFRRRQTTRVMDRQQALAHASLFVEFVHFLEGHVELPADSVPRLTGTSIEEIERAAATCRSAFGLPADAPLDNVVRALENAGVVVVSLGGYVDKVDAFSAESPTGRKVVVLNANDPASRTVFNAAHELGHLVLHRGRETGDKRTEAEANRFASAFLMPRAGISREYPRGHIDWNSLLRLKGRWHVSLQALLRRGADLSLIGAVEYNRACKYVSSMRWRKAEPSEFDTPRPEMILKALDVVRNHAGLSLAEIAYALRLHTRTLGVIAGIEISQEEPGDGVISLSAHRMRIQPRIIE